MMTAAVRRVLPVSFGLQLAIDHTPLLATLFGTVPITLGQCLAWIVLGAVPLAVLELLKVRRQIVGRTAPT
jgi:Ca2+-transporting ATPase